MAKAKEVAPWKREMVEELTRMIESYPVIGILDIHDLPASQFQRTRQKLKGIARVVVSKNTLLALSIDQAAKRRDPKLSELVNHVHGQTALVLAHVNPFKLNKILRENRINAPAKPGSKSPSDIIISAGETDLPPGPVVSELQRLGIKARVQAGKVIVLEDCLLLKKGDTISKEISEVLAKFGIMPLELGLKLRVVYEAGTIFSEEVLEFDETKAIEQIQLAYTNVTNLSMNVNYPTPITIGPMLAKVVSDVRNLALNVCLPIRDFIPTLLTKAYTEMLSLAVVIVSKNERALDEKLKSMISGIPIEEKPEKPKEERKGEELEGLSKLFG